MLALDIKLEGFCPFCEYTSILLFPPQNSLESPEQGYEQSPSSASGVAWKEDPQSYVSHEPARSQWKKINALTAFIGEFHSGIFKPSSWTSTCANFYTVVSIGRDIIRQDTMPNVISVSTEIRTIKWLMGYRSFYLHETPDVGPAGRCSIRSRWNDRSSKPVDFDSIASTTIFAAITSTGHITTCTWEWRSVLKLTVADFQRRIR